MASAAPFAVLGAQVLAGGLDAYGKASEAMAQSDAAKYQAAVSRNMAAYATIQGQAEEARKLAETSQVVGAQRAAFGASGFDVNTGSPMAVQRSSEAIGRMDAATIRANARARAMAALDQSRLLEEEAKNARRSGMLDMLGSILGTASSVGAKWMQYKDTGAMNNG